MNVVFESFDSIGKLVSALNSRTSNSVFAGKEDSKRTDFRYARFSGTESYEEAVQLATKGWDGPLDELKEVARSMNLKTNVTADKHRPTTGIVGYAPCVPNAIRGLPNSMIMTERTPSKVKAITIVYANADVGGIKSSAYLKSGVSILKLIQRLELSGYRVRLQSEFKSSVESDEYAIVRVTLKDWREPVDLKKLTFPFANSGMQRRLGFRWMETVPTLTKIGWCSGYGSTIARHMDYDEQIDFYKRNHLLDDGSYFITKQLCEDEKYDVDRIMNRAGMKL